MDFDYMGTLKDYVNAGDLKDSSFIDSLNAALGGSSDIMSNRTRVYFEALTTFGLVEEEKPLDNVANATNATETLVAYNYCGVNLDDASRKCSIICTDDSACPQGENCHLQVVACTEIESDETDVSVNVTSVEGSDPLGNITLEGDDQDITGNATFYEDQNATVTDSGEITESQVEMAALIINEPTDRPTLNGVALSQSTNYCGTTWTSAATNCAKACPSGLDSECPPNQFCFAEITSCSSNSISITTNWCGRDWNDASTHCSQSCPAGLDSGEITRWCTFVSSCLFPNQLTK
jgi:hypothetical protein